MINRLKFMPLIGLLAFTLFSCSSSNNKEEVEVESGEIENCHGTIPDRFNPSANAASGAIEERDAPITHDGMVWIEGGEFTRGSTDDRGRADELPAHKAKVDGFWIDETEVTNAQFAAFVEATGYVTIAEKKPDWEEIKNNCLPERLGHQMTYL